MKWKGKPLKYVANPVVVDAFEVVGIFKGEKEGFLALTLLDTATNQTSPALATPEMLVRIHLQIGDYWVAQSDGYQYLNPKEVFERKYSPKPVAVP